MRHTSCLKLMLVMAALWSPPGFSQDRPPLILKGWGEVVDPDRDCQFGLDGDRLTITIPAKRHDLSAEVGQVNAPRVLREIEGDFIAQVKVSGNVRHFGDRTSDDFLAYHGAGLLLWRDDLNYIRLERAAIRREESGSLHYGNFQLRKDGKNVSSNRVKLPDQDTYLRIERRGDSISGAASQDGIHWRYFDSIPIELPRRVKLGVDAINTSTERFKATFSELEIYKRESS